MAITQQFNTEPEEFMPVYNRIEVELEETDAGDLANTNYHYWIEVETETLGTETFTVPPDPNGYGYFDAGQILEGFIEEKIAQFNSTGGYVFALERPIIRYRINVYQSWDVSGELTQDPDTEGAIQTSWAYAWSGSFSHHDWTDQINLASPFNTWLANTTNGTDAEFLTNYKTPKVSINDLGWLWVITDTPTDLDQIAIRTYEEDGTPIASFVVDTGVSQAVTASRFLSVAAAPQSLNNIAGGLFNSGSQPVITSSVSYYEIYLRNTVNTACTETITFTIEEPCDNYTSYRLHFLNELGGFDAYTFEGRNRRKRNITRNSYLRTEPNVGASGLTWKHEDNGKQDYYVKAGEQISLKSDYLDDNEWEWLRELVESPQVYLEFDDGNSVRNFKPVRILSTNWQDNVLHLDKLFRLEIDIELANEDFRQRR